jgi:hypothetical protein
MFAISRRAKMIFLASTITILIGGCQTLTQPTGVYSTVGQEDDWDWISQRSHR